MSKLKGNSKAKARAKDRAEKDRNHKKYLRSLSEWIIKFDDPILKIKCVDVVKGEDNSFILDHMRDNGRGVMVQKAGMLKKVLVSTENGVGLAAPQIGSPKRAFVIRLDRNVKDTDKIEVFINPEYVEKSEAKVFGIEGCLSYPDVYTQVERHMTVKIKYLDENFQKQEKTFEGFASRVVQHEMDHIGANIGDEPICHVGNEWRRLAQKVEAVETATAGV